MGAKNTEISARIAEIIERVGESPNSFAKRLGYSRAQTIYDILSGKSAPSYDFFNRFANTEYSANINLQWLLTGKGNMLKTKRTSEPPQAQEPINSEHKDNKNQPLAQEIPPLILDRLLNTIAEKDAIIREQAEELGRLREQIEQFKKGRGHSASDVNTSEIANVG